MFGKKPSAPFFNLYSHGFARVAAAVPDIALARPADNAVLYADLMAKAAQNKARLLVFPELGLTGYACDDLFRQQALLEATEAALEKLLENTRQLPLAAIVGLPLRAGASLFNCAAVIHRGRLLGIVPKTYLPNYGEFYEMRQFASGAYPPMDAVSYAGRNEVPFGTDLLFRFDSQPDFTLGVEICEDLWLPLAPSSYATLAGATVVANLSASNMTLGKPDYRRLLCASQSGRCIAAYIYSDGGNGDSTTDLAWDGHAMIHENGSLRAESERFSRGQQIIYADIDLERLVQDRMRQTSLTQNREISGIEAADFRTVTIEEALPADDVLPLASPPPRFPYVPADPAMRDERCREVFAIQAQALAQRMQATGLKKAVIGISGGLDSTLALLVCAQVMDQLDLPRSNILAYTMPGFATSERTLAQAHELMKTLGCTAAEIDIQASTRTLLENIGHPYAEGKDQYDITFENAQAGERTQHLFRLANLHKGLVVGTSDLSEVALGWCTYGVGDHMAHYHVNASVPKTLVRYLVQWAADTHRFGEAAGSVLKEVLNTAITPELIPNHVDDEPGQLTEDVIGPYPLQDFHLYYILRFGYRPTKVAFMAWCTWHAPEQGAWPPLPGDNRPAYGIDEIRKWLRVFLDRFFRTSQFKRSALPNSPKVGSGGALSPRGDWRAPSDADATTWLATLEDIPDKAP